MIVTKHVKAPLTRTPSDGKGTFQFVIHSNPPAGDADGERIENWVNLPGEFPLGYAHNVNDPGAKIGEAYATPNPVGIAGSGRLDLDNPFAVGVYERMLLSSSDVLALNELSVGFTYDTSKTYKDANGVRVLVDASLEEVSVVYRGAQSATISSLKNRTWSADADLNARLAALERDGLDARIDAMREEPRQRTDAQLAEQIDRLTAGTKAAGGEITPASMSVYQQAAGRLAQSATRAAQAGLPDAAATLLAQSRVLRDIASGGRGTVEEVVAACRPLIQELRNAGQTIAGGNLEKDLLELQGGVRYEIGNEDRVQGSVNVPTGVTSDRDRYQPKGRWTNDVPQRFILE